VKEISALLKMGTAFMLSGVLAMGSGYVARIIVLRMLNLEAAGFYHSAWAIGGLYIGFILDAMGADFFPRLTAVAKNDGETNRLVNEQVEVGLLIAGPGTIAMLAFAPLLIALFYTSKFGPAVGVVRWICLGMVLRVVTWPMGFILLAKGLRKIFIWTELAKNLSYVIMVWLGVKFFGVAGSGMAFFGMYVVYYLIIHAVTKRVSGFAWSGVNLRLSLLLAPPLAVACISWHFLPSAAAMVLGLLLTVVTGFLSSRKLVTLVPLERMPRIVQKTLTVFRLAPRAAGPS
jgi:PST family polysaccharide transporter